MTEAEYHFEKRNISISFHYVFLIWLFRFHWQIEKNETKKREKDSEIGTWIVRIDWVDSCVTSSSSSSESYLKDDKGFN